MQNDLYKLMMYNLVRIMQKRDPERPKEGELSIFQMTQVIADVTNQDAGQVMSDYLAKFKELKDK